MSGRDRWWWGPDALPVVMDRMTTRTAQVAAQHRARCSRMPSQNLACDAPVVLQARTTVRESSKPVQGRHWLSPAAQRDVCGDLEQALRS
jgi:hypothetical protein